MAEQLVNEIIEQAPYPKEELEQIHSALLVASKYLANKIASANKPDSAEDLKMRHSGAQTQQIIAAFTIEHYHATRDTRETRSRNWILNRLAIFWDGYRQLVLEPLRERGIDTTRLKPTLGMEQVFDLQQGVRGMVATAILAQTAGWEVEFPTVDEDVVKGIDLFLKRGGRRVPVQIKCKSGKKFGVVPEDRSKIIDVFIPGERSFFMDYELGIPHRSHAENFDMWLTNHSRRLS